MSGTEAIAGTLTWFLIVWVYLLPTVVVVFRRHHNAGAIAVLNLLLGWTLLGWVAALVWSLTATTDQRKA